MESYLNQFKGIIECSNVYDLFIRMDDLNLELSFLTKYEFDCVVGYISEFVEHDKIGSFTFLVENTTFDYLIHLSYGLRNLINGQ